MGLRLNFTHATESIIDDLINTIDGDTVAMKLLSAPPHSFNVDKTFFKLYRLINFVAR